MHNQYMSLHVKQVQAHVRIEHHTGLVVQAQAVALLCTSCADVSGLFAIIQSPALVVLRTVAWLQDFAQDVPC